jgi:hypothetical protein
MLMDIVCPMCRADTKIIEVFGENLHIRGKCCVCFEEEIDLIILHCGHVVICKDCANEINNLVETTDDTTTRLLFENEIYDGEEVNAILVDLERIIPNLGDIAYRSNFTIRELNKLHDWVVNNQVIYCSQILNYFDDVIEAIQINENNIIEYFKYELSYVVYLNS